MDLAGRMAAAADATVIPARGRTVALAGEALGYNDIDRTIAAVRGGEGKRLTCHQPRSA
jgi:hypothetical protein